MLRNFIKIKLFKLSLLGALSAGIISLIAKEMFKNEKRTKPTNKCVYSSEYSLDGLNACIMKDLFAIWSIAGLLKSCVRSFEEFWKT